MSDEFKIEYLSPGAGAPVRDEFKIEYRAISGFYSTAYVSWLNEPETARGTHKHIDAPVYIRWNPDPKRSEWVEEDPATIIADYVLKRMGHCDDCAIVIRWNDFDDANVPETECDCAWQTVRGLFAEITGETG